MIFCILDEVKLDRIVGKMRLMRVVCLTIDTCIESKYFLVIKAKR